MDNQKEDEIEKMAQIFADKELPWSWPKNKDGEDMAQRVGQAAPFSKKHKGQQNNMIKAFKAGYAAAQPNKSNEAIEFAEWAEQAKEDEITLLNEIINNQHKLILNAEQRGYEKAIAEQAKEPGNEYDPVG